ncbi:MAG TPA: hypothetical protein VF468_00505, partial [Actinomycetota bacterium]|nr:hypothetical protein [Actinomycetota bacterium]
NSLVSGPSSLESARVSKAVIPAPTPSNQVIETSVAPHVVGRDVATDTLFTAPTIDPTTGRFSGPMAPANGGVVEFVGEFAGAVIQPDQGGELSMRLDSITPGQWSTIACCAVGSEGFQTNYYLTLKSPTDSFKVLAPINTSYNFPGPDLVADSSFFTALTVDPDVAQKFEGSPPFTLSAFGAVQVPSPGVNGGWGLGCFAGDITALVGATTALGQCPYNGSRWFDGPSPQQNETMADPNGGNCIPNSGGSTSTLAATGTCDLTAFNNAGQLTGVDVISQAREYAYFNGQWRNMPWLTGTVHRGADYNVYWGTGGVIDSVVDVTHNVVVPFSGAMGSTWGVLNGTNPGVAGGYDGRATVLTMVDIGCVEPIKSAFSPGMDQRIPCDGGTAALETTAVLSDVALFKDVPENSQTAAVSGQGFMIYIVGDLFLMQMAALPAQGTVWAMRTYAGAITGGKGPGSGDTGQPYRFTPAVNPFTAVGATVKVEFGVVNQVNATTKNDLSRVHTVPDPYYVQSAYEASTDQKVLKFVGLPEKAIILIYSVSGVLVRMLEHDGGRYSSTSRSQGSEFDWDLRNRNNQVVASGVYFYHIESGDARRVGRFTVVNFAQ